VSAATIIPVQVVATAMLSIDTKGEGFTELTHDAERFVTRSEAGEGALFLFLRHTSASLARKTPMPTSARI
jgi:thiamine phosphate synthase YjbQ (UPF0047 family)